VDVNHEFQNINANIELDASGNIYVGNGLVTGGTFVPNLNGESSGICTPRQVIKQMACSRCWRAATSPLLTGSLITYSADHIINTWAVTLKAGYDSSIIRFNLETAQFFSGDVVRDSSGTRSGQWQPGARERQRVHRNLRGNH